MEATVEALTGGDPLGISERRTPLVAWPHGLVRAVRSSAQRSFRPAPFESTQLGGFFLNGTKKASELESDDLA